MRGFPQVNIPPSSSLKLHYSRSDRLLTSDPACGRHGNSRTGNTWWEARGRQQRVCTLLIVATRVFIRVHVFFLTHNAEKVFLLRKSRFRRTCELPCLQASLCVQIGFSACLENTNQLFCVSVITNSTTSTSFAKPPTLYNSIFLTLRATPSRGHF